MENKDGTPSGSEKGLDEMSRKDLTISFNKVMKEKQEKDKAYMDAATKLSNMEAGGLDEKNLDTYCEAIRNREKSLEEVRKTTTKLGYIREKLQQFCGS